MNDDFLDLLAALLDAGSRFVVVGAHAMAVHGVPRATGDLDVWVDCEPENVKLVWNALSAFGATVGELGITRRDLETPGVVVQLGVPPRRIDILTEVSGLDFEGAWRNRSTHAVGRLQVPFLGREDLIRNKRASARPKDLADLDLLAPDQGD